MTDDSKARDPKGGLPAGRFVAIALTAATIAILACYALDFYNVSPSEPAMKNLPPLLPAPSPATQAAIVTAIQSHPNPAFNVDLLPPPGSDAAGLVPLFSSLTRTGEENGITSYIHSFGYNNATQESTYLLIEVAGSPPRVIRRRVETHYDP